MLTAYGTVNNVIDAIRGGAQNFVQKPWDNEKLLADIRSAIARYRTEEENVQLKRALKQRYNFPNIIGKSEIMLPSSTWSRRLAPEDHRAHPGRERHRQGVDRESCPRQLPAQGQAFVPVNTGAMPTDLLESTLFGHVKGAFTSPSRPKRVCSSWPTGARSSSTRSALCRSIPRPRFCASSGQTVHAAWRSA